MRHALFEDGVEAFEVVEACGAEMVRHAAFDIVDLSLGCRDDMAGFVRYFCLWKTVAETRVARVSFIHMVQAR